MAETTSTTVTAKPAAPKAQTGNVVGNTLGKLGGQLEEASVLVNYVPEAGNVASGVLKVFGTVSEVAGNLANLEFRKMAHAAVSGTVASLGRVAEAIAPGSGDVDSAAHALTGKSISKQIGDGVADKLVGTGEPNAKAHETPKLKEMTIDPKVLEQARAAVKGQGGEGPGIEESSRKVDIKNGILKARVTEERPKEKDAAGHEVKDVSLAESNRLTPPATPKVAGCGVTPGIAH